MIFSPGGRDVKTGNPLTFSVNSAALTKFIYAGYVI